MHFNLLLLPDFIAMLLLMALLVGVRRRYIATQVDIWMLGIFFLVLEILAHAFYAPSKGIFQGILHALALDFYVCSALAFMVSGTHERRARRKRAIYIIPNALTMLAVTTCYGYGLKDAHLFIGIAVTGLIVGLVSAFIVRLTLWNALWHIILWGSLLLAAHNGDFRGMAYGLLFYLYASVAYAYYESLPRLSLGRYVVVLGFATWSIIFLLHPAVSRAKTYIGVFDEAWNMQKFIIIIGLMVVLMEQQLSHRQRLAFHDELTGLPNRRLFDDRLSQAVQRTDRYGDQTALLMVDLNGFKSINDNFGHQAGDDLLRQIANRLQSALRQTDTVARIGGDEFAVIATGISEEAQAERVINKISRALRTPVSLGKFGDFNISGAVGLALYPRDAADVRSLIAVADARMYSNKREQRKFQSQAS